jgi:Tfp pilus assembly protein PilZ
MTFANTHYHLFPNHINYQESFLNAEEKEFSYERVTETALRRNILQRMFNVGTVVLLTPATGSPSQMHSGLKLQDLENPQETYKQIKEILAASSQPKAA